MTLNLSRPRPVLTKAGIAGLITALAALLTWLGYVGPAAKLSALSDSVGAIIVFVVPLFSHILPALSAQKEVTPIASPRSLTGEVLVPARSWPETPPPPDATVGEVSPPGPPSGVLGGDDGLIPHPAENRALVAAPVASATPPAAWAGAAPAPTASYAPQHAAEAVITDAPSTDAGPTA